MRNKNLLITSFLVIAAMLLSACAGVAAAQSADPTATPNSGTASGEEAPTVAAAPETPRTINVNGSGLVYVTPDMAYVTIGVHSEGKDAVETLAANNTQSQDVMDAIKTTGIDAKDIQTTNLSVYPRQEYDTDGKPTGEITYVVDNSVRVTVRNLESLGDVLDSAVSSGANTVSGVQFDISDKSAALSEARRAAVAEAQTKAEELAAAAGVTLGPVQTISEYSYNPGPVMYDMRAGAEMAAASSVPVSSGQMTLSIEVNIVYDIQ